MIKLVLFDLDDTLISEDEYVKSGYHHVAKIIENKYLINYKDVYKRLYLLYRQSTRNVFDRLLDQYNVKYIKEDILLLVNEYRNHIPTIYFYEDVLPVIEKLKMRNIKIGIISDGYLSTQYNKADVLNLYSIFDKVIFTEELGKEYWKPHPKAFEIMKEYFNVEYEEILYIGDNPQKDFYVKCIYPIKTIRIMREYNLYKDKDYYRGIIEDQRISNLNELLQKALI